MFEDSPARFSTFGDAFDGMSNSVIQLFTGRHFTADIVMPPAVSTPPDEIARYIESGEWRGKAGGYAIQGHAGALVRWIEGSYSNVVGLPLYETASLLEGVGFRAFARHG